MFPILVRWDGCADFVLVTEISYSRGLKKLSMFSNSTVSRTDKTRKTLQDAPPSYLDLHMELIKHREVPEYEIRIPKWRVDPLYRWSSRLDADSVITKLVEAPWAYVIRVYVDRKLGSSTWLRLRHLHTNRSDQFEYSRQTNTDTAG